MKLFSQRDTAVPAGPGQAIGAAPEETPEQRLQGLAAQRIAIEGVAPSIDCGRFPAKGVAGRLFTVEADIFCDGHDKIDAALQTRKAGEAEWRETRMRLVVNDRWRGTAVFDGLLYLLVGDVTVCYRCGAHYRGFPPHPAHQPFDLGVGERYRQERIRRELLK